MADALSISFVAGAVETEAQLEQLRAVGCRLVQGNAVAAPMPAAQVPGYLKRITPVRIARLERRRHGGSVVVVADRGP